MSYTNQFSETNALLSIHWPATRQVAAHVGDWVLMSRYHRAFCKVKVGAMGSSATLIVKLQEAQDASGTGAQDITGKVTTALTQAGSDANSVVGIELQTEELDVNDGFEYVRFVVTIAVADCLYDAELWGIEPRYAPVSTTIFDEIIA
jgi:hypothetical protein